MAEITPVQRCQLNNIREFLGNGRGGPQLIPQPGKEGEPQRYAVQGMPGVTVESSVKDGVTSSTVTLDKPEKRSHTVINEGDQQRTQHSDTQRPTSPGGFSGSFPTEEGLRFDKTMEGTCTQVSQRSAPSAG